VSGITPNSPAADADLQIDDVVLEFDGATIEDDNHLINRVSLTEVGKEVALVVLRDGVSVSMRMKVGDRADFEMDE
jgi:serine protease Do